MSAADLLLDCADTIDPDQRAGERWLAHMRRGEFEGAWLESDAIRQRGAYDPHRLWDGEPLDGKRVMLRCLHGFGDAVQFLQYLPKLREIAAQVTVQVAPRLVELAKCFQGIDCVITWGDAAPEKEPAWDSQIEIMELPYIFRTEAHQLPVATNYLKLPVIASDEQAVCGHCLQVGLVWTAGDWNQSRSIAPDILEALLDVRGCEFWNLQACESDVTPGALLEDDSCRTSIVGLAARISRLDLVVTVDTLAAHLAGAFGVPAWVLLQHEADWRWMQDRDDSPWYPSLRLFRQPVAGDWSSVVAHVSRALLEQVDVTLSPRQGVQV